MLGLDPGPFTFRELWQMHDGFQQDSWNKISSLIWAAIQPHSKKTLKPADFNPLAKQGKPVVVSIKEAKALACEAMGVSGANDQD